MERLTKTNWKNLDPWETCGQGMYCTRNCHEDGGCANGCPVPKNYRRLAEYEDTGLAPDEIHKLNDFEQSQIATLLKEHFVLKKERNYWRNEALKWASELGEQKIEGGKNEGN